MLEKSLQGIILPGMTNDIQKLISNCSVCNTFHQEQHKEPMVAPTIPSRYQQSNGKSENAVNKMQPIMHKALFSELDPRISKPTTITESLKS